MIGVEEKEAILRLTPFLGEHPVIFDCGSNKGHFAELVLSELKENCQLHLFEPTKMLLDYTRIKFEYDKNIIYNQLGVSDKQGKKSFYYFENYNNEISSLYPDKEGWKDFPMKEGEIYVTSIDKYCTLRSIHGIDFLKLDIEGSESEAISGCSDMIKADKIKIIQVEYGGHYVRANKTFQGIIDFVTPLGYKIYKYSGSNFCELTDFKEDYTAENYYITKYEIRNHSIGWDKEFIINTAYLPKCDMVLEVGAFEGLTTKYICENLLNEGGRVNVVDPLTDEYIEGDTEHPYFRNQYQRFLGNTRGLNLNLYRGKSEDELPKLNALRHDLCYIDGNHNEENVYFDLCWCFAITKVDGYLLADDYEWREETKRGIDRFLNEFAGSLEIIEKSYQVLIQKKANQYNKLTYEYYK